MLLSGTVILSAFVPKLFQIVFDRSSGELSLLALIAFSTILTVGTEILISSEVGAVFGGLMFSSTFDIKNNEMSRYISHTLENIRDMFGALFFVLLECLLIHNSQGVVTLSVYPLHVSVVCYSISGS